LIASIAAVALVATSPVVSVLAAQESGPSAKLPKDISIRGCLMGSRITQIEPVESGAAFPESLGVTGIRVIRSQLKELRGHQVELIGTAEGVGRQTSGILIADSGTMKFYIGGGDPGLGEDLRRVVPPTFYVHTIKNIAPTCAAQPSQ
jgi:hypothetical protein